MKKLFIRISAIFTVIILILSASFIPSLAADPILFIENKSFNDISKDLSGSGWSWKASSYTLTLNGYNGGSISFSPLDKNSELKLVVNNKNTITSDTGAALGIKCNAFISGGGELYIKAPNADRGIYFEGNATVTVSTLDIYSGKVGIHAFPKPLIMKNCRLNLDCSGGFLSRKFVFESCSISFKNTTNLIKNRLERFGEMGVGEFKKCKIDITLGAQKNISGEVINCSVFEGCAANLNATSLNIKKTPGAIFSETSKIYNVHFPDGDSEISITNGSKISFDTALKSFIDCSRVKISDSTVTGSCEGRFIGSYYLNITNSVVDITSQGKNDADIFYVMQIDAKNSTLKAKSNASVWKADFSDFVNNRKLLLTDTELDFESGKPSFGDGYKLNYTNPDEWAIEINGKPSDKTVRSADIDFAQNRVVIKRVDKTPPKPVSSSSADTSDKTNVGSNPAASEPSDSSESAVSEETSEPDIENETEDEKDESNEVDTDVLTDGAIEEKAPEKSLWIILGAVAVLVVVVGAAAVILLKFKKK